MIYVRLIDGKGLFIEDTFVEELTEFTIETPCPSGLYLPRWNGTEWIEGMAQEDIDLLKNVVAEQTLEDKVAEQELVINDLISLLADKGVIY